MTTPKDYVESIRQSLVSIRRIAEGVGPGADERVAQEAIKALADLDTQAHEAERRLATVV